MEDYQNSFTVNNSIEEVYAAITQHIPEWWSNDLTGASMHRGDQFTISFGQTQKTMEIAEALVNERISWHCIKAYIDMPSLKNKSEWVGTTMTWTLSKSSAGTIIHFLHKGLQQDIECYSICEAGWNTFLKSLESYLVTGAGKPFLKSAKKQDSKAIV